MRDFEQIEDKKKPSIISTELRTYEQSTNKMNFQLKKQLNRSHEQH